MQARWGTKDDFTTISFHLVLFSVAQLELAKSIPVHSIFKINPKQQRYTYFVFTSNLNHLRSCEISASVSITLRTLLIILTFFFFLPLPRDSKCNAVNFLTRQYTVLQMRRDYRDNLWIISHVLPLKHIL